MNQVSGTPRRIGPDDASGRPGGWLVEGPRREFGRHETIWQLLDETLLDAPDAPALACGDRVMSRASVRSAAERWGAVLPGKRVGVHMARSPESVLLTLAVWCRGGVVVPIAVEHPAARVAAIAQSCDLDVVLADRVLDLPGYAVAETDADLPATLHVRAGEPARDGEVPGLCLIVHTSGSSGTPKGVLISHANLLNRIASLAQLLAVRPDDRVLYKTSAVFDVHVWEFVLPLAAGALLVIFPQERLFDLREVAACLVDARVTVAGFVPALLRLLLDMPAVTAVGALRAVFCGGEAWDADLARAFHARLPGRLLFNSYGPAETTLSVANWPVPDDPDLHAIELGAPMPNVLFLVEDEPGAGIDHSSDGERYGSLCIGGAQTAMGVLDGGGRAGERFFERPAGDRVQRFYDTGDRVCLDVATGRLRFRGRQDNQVKLNGVRIELEEIEAAVKSIEAVQDCVALVARRGEHGVLCAAYRTDRDARLTPTAVREACSRLLPRPFVPARLVQVERLPLTASGKHDRRAAASLFQATAG